MTYIADDVMMILQHVKSGVRTKKQISWYREWKGHKIQVE